MMDVTPGDLGDYLSTETIPEAELRRLFGADTPLVIFDIGACEGEDSIRYARRFPRARIFAFEPLPANQPVIRKNLEQYGIHSVEFVPLALSDRAGTSEFHVSSGHPPQPFAGSNWNYGNKSSSLLPPAGAGPMFGWIEFKQTVMVECETFDRFCAQRGISEVDFVHMDVQGAEALVLAGAQAMLPAVKMIWTEVAKREFYRGQCLSTELDRVMRERGFALVRASVRGEEADHLYVNRRWRAGRKRIRQALIEDAVHSLRAVLGRLKRKLPGARRRVLP